jgi:antitoxin (DNA-binding transcriptional repressor) of toxin-antitoxin stability system
MRTVDIGTAKTHLSRRLDQVAVGEESVIARAGKPLARWFRSSAGARPASRVWIVQDFDEPLPEQILAAFCGERP